MKPVFRFIGLDLTWSVRHNRAGAATDEAGPIWLNISA